MCIIALDPGSDKCGIAVVAYDLRLLEKKIVYLGDLSRALPGLLHHQPDLIVIGTGTASRVVRDLIDALNLNLEVRYGNEKNTTYEARQRYFVDHPPRGFWRLIPLSLQYPDEPLDDYAAWLIGERYLLEHHLNK